MSAHLKCATSVCTQHTRNFAQLTQKQKTRELRWGFIAAADMHSFSISIATAPFSFSLALRPHELLARPAGKRSSRTHPQSPLSCIQPVLTSRAGAQLKRHCATISRLKSPLIACSSARQVRMSPTLTQPVHCRYSRADDILTQHIGVCSLNVAKRSLPPSRSTPSSSSRLIKRKLRCYASLRSLATSPELSMQVRRITYARRTQMSLPL